MGITTDIEELKNLQKLILKSICNEFGFISIYKSRPSFDYLENISGYLYDMIRTELKEDKEHYLSRIVSSFKSLNDYSEDYRKTYTECLRYINNSGLELVIELFNLFIEIGKKIKDYLLSQNVQTIEDLKMIVTKLKSIRSLVGEKEFQFSGYTRSVLNDFHYTSDVQYWINDYSERRNNDILEDIKKTKQIERYVQSILR